MSACRFPSTSPTTAHRVPRCQCTIVNNKTEIRRFSTGGDLQNLTADNICATSISRIPMHHSLQHDGEVASRLARYHVMSHIRRCCFRIPDGYATAPLLLRQLRDDRSTPTAACRFLRIKILAPPARQLCRCTAPPYHLEIHLTSSPNLLNSMLYI